MLRLSHSPVSARHTEPSISPTNRLLNANTNPKPIPPTPLVLGSTLPGISSSLDPTGALPPSWCFGFSSGHTGQLVHRVMHLQLRSVSLLSELSLALRESPNGQQFGAVVSGGSANFTFLAPPLLYSASPASGPYVGGTALRLSGVNLRAGDDYRCLFNASALGGPTVVAASWSPALANEIRCGLPPLDGTPWAEVRVTLNGQQYTPAGLNLSLFGGQWRFQNATNATDNPDLVGLQLGPLIGPLNGSTALQLFGVEFSGGSDYRCRFTLRTGVVVTTAQLLPADVARALYHNHIAASNASDTSSLAAAVATPERLLVCSTPPSNSSDFYDDEAGGNSSFTTVEFSANGQQYYSSPDMQFRYYTPPLLAVVSPSTGPTAGATDITLSFGNATRPHTGGVLLCFFDSLPVPATRLNDDSISCSSPVDLANDVGLGNLSGPLTELTGRATATVPDILLANGTRVEAAPNNTDLLELGSDATLGGNATYRTLQLAASHAVCDEIAGSGSAVLRLPSAGSRASPLFGASVLVRVYGTTGSSSFSLSYGDIPNGVAGSFLSEWGVSGGLRVALLTSTEETAALGRISLQQLHVLYDGVRVVDPLTVSPPIDASHGHLDVRYDQQGLYVSIDGQPYLTAHPVTDWSPQPHWSVGFGGYATCETGSIFDETEVTVTGFRVRRGANVWPAATRLTVSLNGQQVDVNRINFTRYQQPTISSVSPAAGPVDGGTAVILSGR